MLEDFAPWQAAKSSMTLAELSQEQLLHARPPAKPLGAGRDMVCYGVFMSAVPDEIAVGLHLKLRRDASGGWTVYDPRTGKYLPVDEFDAKVAIFEDRLFGWFLDQAPSPGTNGDYVALMIALSQIEGLGHYRNGEEPPDGQAGNWFKKALVDIVGAEVTDQAAKNVWKAMRCGLFHAGFTKGPVFVTSDLTQAVEVHGKFTLVNPQHLLSKVRTYACSYFAELRDPKNTELRQKFERLFDERWKNGKSPSIVDAVLSGSA